MLIEHAADGTPTKVTMKKPSDMHHHFRHGSTLNLVAPMVAKRFQAAIAMPNLVPPITTAQMVEDYYYAIVDAAEAPFPDFNPLMTYYLTDTLDPLNVGTAVEAGDAVGVKYYPRGLTTNSDSGVRDPAALWSRGTKPYDVARMLAGTGGVLLVHGADGFDVSGTELDPYDQEKHFINETLPRIRDAHPRLRISFEHLSTVTGVEYLREHGGETLGCSLTAHHLLLDRRDVFRGGINPHRHWWPIIQPREHKEELRKFAAEGHEYVWLGSDSAPHPAKKKECACCAGGVLMAHAGIELYLEAFEDMGALDVFEDFASNNGPAFFGVFTEDAATISLVREPWTVPNLFRVEVEGFDEPIVPFRLGEEIRWKLVD